MIEEIRRRRTNRFTILALIAAAIAAAAAPALPRRGGRLVAEPTPPDLRYTPGLPPFAPEPPTEVADTRQNFVEALLGRNNPPLEPER
ncbi:MAG: hypothetical protein LBR07_04235 [Puniceicoccales bacterium]|jgi:hypothetical protein|nr:hypothetical protein [Puniceicoccales bacterium]